MELNYNAPTHYAGQLEVWAEVDTVPLSAMYAKLVDEAGGHGQVGYESLDGSTRDALRGELFDACEQAIEESMEVQGYTVEWDAVRLAAERLADAIERSPAPDYVYENPSAYKARQRAERRAEKKTACA